MDPGLNVSDGSDKEGCPLARTTEPADFPAVRTREH